MIGLAARDVFDALFHPGGRSPVSRRVAALTWAVVHRAAGDRGKGLALAGPLALALVIVTWAVLLICGFALLYLPHVPESFTLAPELRDDPAALTSLYFSVVTLATLGYGEATPTGDILQVLAPLEAMVGFGLLTASISWLLSIHPVLARRRSLAYEIALMERAERDAGVPLARLPAEELEQELEELHARLTVVERDLVAYPIAFYFAELDRRFSLPDTLPVLATLIAGVDDRELSPRGRLHAAILREAIDDFAATARGFPGYGGLSARATPSAGARRPPSSPPLGDLEQAHDVGGRQQPGEPAVVDDERATRA